MKIFTNRSIITKIGCITSIIILLCILSSGALLINFEINMAHRMAEQYASKMKKNLENREKSEKEVLNKMMKNTLDVLTTAAGDFLFNYNLNEIIILIKSVLNNHDIVAVSVIEYNDLPVYAGWKTPQKKIEKALPEKIKQNKQLISISKEHYVNNEKLGVITIYYSEKSIEKSVNQLRKSYKAEMDRYKQSVNNQLKKLIIIQSCSVGLIIIFIILSLVLSIKKIVLKPLNEVERIHYKLSDFDFTISINDNKNDEIGKLLKSIKTVVYQIQNLIGDVKNTAHALNMTSEKTVRVSKQFAQNIHKTGIESKNVSTASNNMSMRIQKIFGKVKITNSNTKQISDTSEQIACNIQHLSEALDLMNLSMKSVSENADKGSNISKKAVEMAEQAKNSIKNLEEASNEIGDVIRVIMKISDKTNLLALNAAIEAAAAGEAGKGFAVVSSAIQKFADQSALAAENISSRITSLQENAMNTIIVIMEITDIIQVMNDSISNIKIGVYNQSAASDQISANALGVKEKSDQIAQKLAELSKAFDQTTHDIDYLSKESDQVSSSIQAVSRQTDDSSNEISQLNHITNQLDELSNDLHQQVDVFKI